MAEQPTPNPLRRRRTRARRAPDEPELTVVPGAAGDDRATPKSRPRNSAGRSFGRIFRSQPIEGTDLSVRAFSVNEADALTDDDANADLDDREFTARAVHRQLKGQAVPTLDEVRGWTDEQLLAGARAMLSFPTLKVLVNGIEQPPEPEEVAGIPDPLTFASFRQAITAYPKRIIASIAKTAARITDVGLPKMMNALDISGIKEISRHANILAGEGPESAMSAAIASLAKSPAITLRLPKLDFMKGTMAQLKSLSDTRALAESLGKFQATTLAAERLAGLRFEEAPLRDPIVMPAITPYHAEVDAIDALGERIDAMAQNQAKADREQLEAMTAQAELTREHGVALQGVIAEVAGLRNDQRWPNRAVIIGAFIAGALLVFGIIAALPVINELLGL